MPRYSSTDAAQIARNDFMELLGREPTASELALAIPQYQQDWNGGETGRAYVAQFAEGEKQKANSPEAKMAAAKAKAGEYYGNIDQMFQSSLGRAASDAEKQHFGTLMATGDYDAYTIGQFLQNLPEAVRAEDAKFRQSLSSELQGQDAQYFNEKVLPSIQSQFAQQGRDVRSSGFANSLAQAATQQNRQRESFLSNLSAQQYQGNKGNARADYENTRDRASYLQDYARQRSDALSDQSRQRMYDLQDFNMQKQVYENYLRQYGKRKSWVNDLASGLNMANSFANIIKGWGSGSPTDMTA